MILYEHGESVGSSSAFLGSHGSGESHFEVFFRTYTFEIYAAFKDFLKQNLNCTVALEISQ